LALSKNNAWECCFYKNQLIVLVNWAHLSNDDPSKALALSFHGGTGTGKNHVSKIIANHIYKEGMKSKFVHMSINRNHHLFSAVTVRSP
jgi:chromosomal replication initiation ATPase DnaA